MTNQDFNQLVETFKGTQSPTYTYSQSQCKLGGDLSNIDFSKNILVLPEDIKDKLNSELLIQGMCQVSLDLSNTFDNYNKLLMIYNCTSRYMELKNNISGYNEFKKYLSYTNFTKTTYDFFVNMDKFTEWDLQDDVYNYMTPNTKLLMDTISNLLDKIYTLLEEGFEDSEFIFLKTMDDLSSMELDGLMLYIHNITVGLTYIILAYPTDVDEDDDGDDTMQNVEG